MAERRPHNGFMYERARPGEPWQLVGPVEGGAGTIMAAPADPRQPYQVQESRADAARATAEAPYAGDRAAADARKAAADAASAEAAARRAQLEAQNAPDPRMRNVGRELQTDSVLDVINTARRQIGEGWSTGNMAGSPTFQGIWGIGQNSADLAGTLSGLQGNVIVDTLERLRAQSSTGASGFGSLTEREAERLAAAVGALQQTQSSEALLQNLARVERHYRNAQALLNNEDPRDPAVAERYGIISAEGPAPQQRGGQLAPGAAERDPGLAGLNATVDRMIRSGRGEPEIRAYLNRVRPTMGDRAEGLAEAIAQVQQRPDVPFNVDLEATWVPATGVAETIGNIGMSPFGAGAIGAADTVTFGTLDNLTDNPELSRAVMTGVQAENPNSYLAGQVFGGVTTGLGLEAGLARGGLTGLARARVGDAAFGGLYGAGSADEGSRLGGAALGAGTGFLGGAAGRTVARGAGRALSGVTDPIRRRLNEAGVPMTVGQILGGGAARTEDRIAGLPLVGDQIRNRRVEGLEGFNAAAFNEALAPINANTGGQIAEAGAQRAHDAIGDAYRAALGGTEVVPDLGFERDLTAAVGRIQAIPRVGEEVRDSVGEIVNPTYFTPADTLTGDNLQPMLQELRGLRSGYASDPLGHRIGQGIRDVEGSITGMFERQAPEVMPAYRAADEAYRNQSVIDDAVLKALNTGGTFSPAQLGMAARSNTVRFGGRRAAAEGDRPFFDLQRAGQEILPSTVPDSGTAGRAILPAVALGLFGGGSAAATTEGGAAEKAGSGAAIGAIITALAAAPYSRGAREVLQRALFSGRPETAERLGQAMIDYNRIAGLLAAPAAVTGVAGQ